MPTKRKNEVMPGRRKNAHFRKIMVGYDGSPQAGLGVLLAGRAGCILAVVPKGPVRIPAKANGG